MNQKENTETAEARARSMGWVPAAEFRGDQKHFVSAEEFIHRGEQIMPILRENNRKLEARLQQSEAENRRMNELLKVNSESVEALKETLQQQTIETVKRAKAELREQLVAARENGDVRTELEIQDRLDELRTANPAAQDKSPAQPAPQPPVKTSVSPEFAQWHAANPWFGTDVAKTAQAMAVSQELANSPQRAGLSEAQFYARVSTMLAERNQQAPGAIAKVGSGTGGAGTQPAGGDGSWESLPPEARQVCEYQARKLVGEGRTFKNMGEWKKYYAQVYHESNRD